jgi:hypothetical protein
MAQRQTLDLKRCSVRGSREAKSAVTAAALADHAVMAECPATSKTLPDQLAASATIRRLSVSPIEDIMSTGAKDSKLNSEFLLTVSRR